MNLVWKLPPHQSTAMSEAARRIAKQGRWVGIGSPGRKERRRELGNLLEHWSTTGIGSPAGEKNSPPCREGHGKSGPERVALGVHWRGGTGRWKGGRDTMNSVARRAPIGRRRGPTVRGRLLPSGSPFARIPFQNCPFGLVPIYNVTLVKLPRKFFWVLSRTYAPVAVCEVGSNPKFAFI